MVEAAGNAAEHRLVQFIHAQYDEASIGDTGRLRPMWVSIVAGHFNKFERIKLGAL